MGTVNTVLNALGGVNSNTNYYKSHKVNPHNIPKTMNTEMPEEQFKPIINFNPDYKPPIKESAKYLYSTCSTTITNNDKYWDQLYDIIKYNKMEELDDLLYNDDLELTSEIISFAVGCGSIECLIKLLEKTEFKINFSNIKTATENGRYEMLSYLLDKMRFNINREQCYLLRTACYHGHYKIVELLLESQFDYRTTVRPIYKNYALTIAFKKNYMSIVELLIKDGVVFDYNIIDDTITDDQKEVLNTIINKYQSSDSVESNECPIEGQDSQNTSLFTESVEQPNILSEFP